MMNLDSMARIILLLSATAFTLPASAQSPLPEVGSAAPPLELVAADGSRHSLATIDGPRVLIFYRGLW